MNGLKLQQRHEVRANEKRHCEAPGTVKWKWLANRANSNDETGPAHTQSALV
jgi:hypothetical protein